MKATKTDGPRARDPGAFKSLLVRTNIAGWRALKMLAVEKETTLKVLAVEAFNDLLKSGSPWRMRFWSSEFPLASRLRRDALETDFRSRIIAKQIRRLCFHLIGQKKLAALALAVLIGLPIDAALRLPSPESQSPLLRDQVTTLTVRDYARFKRVVEVTVVTDKIGTVFGQTAYLIWVGHS
jgi:hypothetical protein